MGHNFPFVLSLSCFTPSALPSPGGFSRHMFVLESICKPQEKDRADEHNLVRLLDHFIYRGHQCIIFEMLSYNLYDLLKYTKFHGVSLTLLRKFAKQILRALQFLSHRDVSRPPFLFHSRSFHIPCFQIPCRHPTCLCE